MIITQLSGGLGNQMFQYALARQLAEKNKTELLLDVSSYGQYGDVRPKELEAFSRSVGLFRFRVKTKVASANEISILRDNFYRSTIRDRTVRQVRRVWPNFLWAQSHKVEKQYRFQPEALEWPDNIYLQGFWQSPKYFNDIAPLIRQEFQIVDDVVHASVVAELARLKARFPVVVSLHVRRGDLACAYEIRGKRNITYGAPVTKEYINRAMAKFAPETCFFVFSDTPKDIEWCRENVKSKNVTFSNAESDLWDFRAMSLCDHHIIANSTFSWWAAWLGTNSCRRVIAPLVWSPPDARSAIITDDLLPDDWECI